MDVREISIKSGIETERNFTVEEVAANAATVTAWDAKANERRIAEIDARLAGIDLETIRPARAVNTGRDAQDDRDKLNALEDEAEALRLERMGL